MTHPPAHCCANEVIVNPQGRSPRAAYVLGAADRAPALPLTPLMTPLKAVETGGGLARDADPTDLPRFLMSQPGPSAQDATVRRVTAQISR